MTRYLERPGHLNLADGSLLRLDFECRKWCASYYIPGPDRLELRAYSYGSFDAMLDLLADWSDAFEASTSLAVGVKGRGAAPGDTSTAQPPLNLGEIA